MEPQEHPYETAIEAFTLKKVPWDLLACYLWLAAALLCIYLPVLSGTFLRVLFGIPMVLFIPGYALIAALFPGKGDIDGIERTALSFGLSIAVVPPKILCIILTFFKGCRHTPSAVARHGPMVRYERFRME